MDHTATALVRSTLEQAELVSCTFNFTADYDRVRKIGRPSLWSYFGR